QRLDVGAQILHIAAALRAQLTLESPAAERQEARPDSIARLCGIEPVLQIAHEDVRPEIRSIDRQALQLQTTARTEIVVRHEIAWQLRRLLFLGPGERLGRDDVVLFLDLFPREHHLEYECLELLAEFFGLRGRSAPL